MESTILSKCINAHPALQICLQENCIQPTLICDKKTEECKHKHQKCSISIPVDEVLRDLLLQEKASEAVDNQTIECYDDLIKTITAQKDEYLKLTKNPQFKLNGNQMKLLELLRSGLAESIFSDFVNNTLKQMPEHSEEKKVQEKKILTISLEKPKNQIKNQLNIIKALRNKNIQEKQKAEKRKVLKTEGNEISKTKVQTISGIESKFKFSEQLCSKQYFQIMKSGNHFKINKHTPDKFLRFIALVPEIQMNKDTVQRVQLKLIRDYSLHFGIGHINTLKQKKFIPTDYSSLNHGLYVFSGYQGKTYNSTKQEQNNKLCDMRTQSGNVVQLEFIPQKKKLVVRNLSKKQAQVVINFEFKENDPLHFCVGGFYANEEVQIFK